MSKKWTVLIIPNSSGKIIDLSVNGKVLRAGAGAFSLVILACVIISSVWLYIWKHEKTARIERLQLEVNQRSQELDTLKVEFGKLIVLEDKLRAIAGLRPRQAPENKANAGGQGGPEPSPVAFSDTFEYCSIPTSSGPNLPENRGLLEALIATQTSFTELLEYFEKEEDRLACVPSINPIASQDAWISSGFGYRTDPINGKRRFHEGIDLVAPRRTPVMAPADGVVIFSGWREGLGRTVELRHEYGYRTIYGHNDKLLKKKGDHVTRGDVISLVGSSGRSTGPHLHYEVRLNGKLVNPYRHILD
ncbi:MAG: M23 family metallopeptidase [Candidatus Abyssobacteria bacterium SURF_17]|uniref:M23 family metallopeptidase n=1 Tax=Candidatus Abyssobacteria bacterium SURF_17 TaxID=2093361 RepID=A0A419EZP3_9BACT|nr:MAG: M23 family metallopeptidase [Candidatus Abyssubacteria bacterium SURF_17]